jgi:hypothetical protein
MITSPGKKRLVLTSVNQLITLAKTSEKVKQLTQFKNIHTMELSTTPSKTCNCAKPFKTPDLNKQVVENTLSAFKPKDFQDLRDALDLDELCYYLRNKDSKKLEMFCV